MRDSKHSLYRRKKIGNGVFHNLAHNITKSVVCVSLNLIKSENNEMQISEIPVTEFQQTLWNLWGLHGKFNLRHDANYDIFYWQPIQQKFGNVL